MNNTFPYMKVEGKENGATDCVMAMLTDVVARTIATQVIERMATPANNNQEQ